MTIAELPTGQLERRMPGYIATAALAAVVALTAAFGLIKGTELAGRQKLPHQVLIDYQRQKLAGPIGDVVFLGDSSLGTAVDAALWQSLTGKTATNFALTGSHGYAGTLDMLRAILANHSPTDVVIVQTASMMRRTPKEYVPSMSPDATGFLQRFRDLWLETMNVNEFAASADFLLRRVRGKPTGVNAIGIENDYVLQVDRIAEPPTSREWDPKSINEANLLELTKIASICHQRSLTCVYLHGPLATPYCMQQKTYFARVNALIRSSGLQLAQDHPPCLPPNEVGNSFDHTKLPFKRDMTRRIAAILQPYLTK